MPDAPRVFRPPGSKSRKAQKREFDKRRGSARSRGYTTDWDKAAAAHLAAHPLCEMCLADGIVTGAELVDHMYRHGGHRRLFWLRRYWMSCCHACHNGPKQRIEHAGFAAVEAFAVRMGRPALSVQCPDLVAAARKALGEGGENP